MYVTPSPKAPKRRNKRLKIVPHSESTYLYEHGRLVVAISGEGLALFVWDGRVSLAQGSHHSTS